MIKKMSLEIVAGYLVSPLVFICFSATERFLLFHVGVEIFWGGDMAGMMFGFVLGIPLGVLAGIFLVDKRLFKTKGYNVFGLVTGFILSEFGIALGIMLHDRFGMLTLPFGLFLTVLLAVTGYNAKAIFRDYRWFVKYVSVFLCGVLLTIGFLKTLSAVEARDKQRIEKFIDQIIVSAINKTKFYQTYSLWHAEEGLQKYSSEFSSSCRIFIYEYRYGRGEYKALIIFDNGKLFNIEGHIHGRSINLGVIEPTKWTQLPKEG